MKKKVVILGGGIGALTAAYYLTDPALGEQACEVELYQMGWRLGGKAASSRNPAEGGRIEEHGLHVWFGFYENAFATLRSCYQEMKRPPQWPFPTVDSAFRGVDALSMMEPAADRGWRFWQLRFRPNQRRPGIDGLPSALWVLEQLLDALLSRAASLRRAANGRRNESWAEPARTAAFGRALDRLEQARREGLATLTEALRGELLAALRVLEGVTAATLAVLGPTHRRAHLLRVLDLGLVIFIGVLEDRLLTHGLSSIDDEDFAGWLRRHGAGEETAWSTPVRALYDCCFAFDNGDVTRPDFAAGAALGCALRIALLYNGHLLYKMNAGMGDVVVTPLYLVLRQRGVKFHFFHRVTGLHVSADGSAIERVEFERQATPRLETYEPLQLDEPGGVPYWPPAPDYRQLQEGAALQHAGADLESRWSDWPGVGRVERKLGADEQLVLGISLGALGRGYGDRAGICDALSDARPAWQRLLTGLPSIQTQAAQLWLRETPRTLGWQGADTMVAAPEPMDVWADMSHLLAQERWPAGSPPQSLLYFCGPLLGNLLQERPASDSSVPALARAAVQAQTARWLRDYARFPWPRTAPPGAGGFNEALLYRLDDAAGGLEQQWLRANIDPSERYVLSPSGRNHLRLRPDGALFRNLVLAGDWTRTAINAGCVEAAVMSGMAAARAITGWPRQIAGEDFLQG